MKRTIALWMLVLLLPSAYAAIDFTIEPATQTAQAGDTIQLTLDVNNDETFWGFSVRLNEDTPLTFDQATASARLDNGFNDAIDSDTYLTLYSIFAGTSAGIVPGTGPLFTIDYTIPAETAPGTIQITPSQLTVSDSEGGNLPAGITGASITIEEPPEEEPISTGFYLPPDMYGEIDTTVDVPLCVENTDTRALTDMEATITHDQNIVSVAQVIFNQGDGEATVEEGSTSITLTDLNIQGADCSDETGETVATIRYYLHSIGVTPLMFDTAQASDGTTPFSVQALNNQNGQLGVNVNDVTKSCEVSPGILTQGSIATVTYKISNPFPGINIGGIDEIDTFDSGATGFSQGAITNLVGGASNIVSSNPAAGQLRTVISTTSQPLFTGAGTFNIYSVPYTSSGTTTLGSHTFGITPPPPPALEVSDDQHQDVTVVNADCTVDVIAQCVNDSDCNDNNVCNGIETCDPGGDCIGGTPLDCDDGDPNTIDSCDPINGCQHKRVRQGGGGGGGGSKYEDVNLCFSCQERNPELEDDWTCCGRTFDQIDTFCNNPEVYSTEANNRKCSLPSPEPAIEPNPFFSTIEPRPEQEQQETTTETPPSPEPPRIPPQRQAPVQETEPDGFGSIFEWIIAVLLVGLLTGGIIYMLKHRRGTQPAEPPTPPAEPFTPPPTELPELEQPPEPPTPEPTPKPRPAAAVIPPKKAKKTKKKPTVSADFSELDKYAAEVRKRLKKQTAKKSKKAKKK